MAVDKSELQLLEEIEAPSNPPPDVVVEVSDEPLSIENEDGTTTTVEMTSDGGAVVDLNKKSEIDTSEVEHGSNLAEYVPESALGKLASDLITFIRADKMSRADWERTYIKGLENLGLKIEERSVPWPGACAATHPLLGESVVRFQAQTIQEIFPAHGPVKVKIVGLTTVEKEKQAKRVQEYMNFVILNQMTEYRSETDKMLFSLPLAGSAFRKIYYDETLSRPISVFIPAEDVIVNYAATSIQDAERVTHVMQRSDNEVKKLQVAGLYRDIPLTSAAWETEQVKEAIDDLTGTTRTGLDTDTRRTLFEVHVDLDIPGFEDPDGIALPYVVTVDRTAGTILSIYRNWKEDDADKKKRQHFVHYEFIPGLGFYGFGLVHLIGGLADAATSLLRQLVDAGTLANLPGGLKTRGLRITGDDTPILPGEFRDVDVPGGTLSDNLSFLPYKEPSATLHALMDSMVESGRRFASMADLKVADMNAEAPVGTTLAIMERAMKVQTAIQARIHSQLKIEFRMLAEVISTQTEPKYPYETKEGQDIKKEDFDDRIDIIPVSDPNAGTMSQRIMQYQAVLQLAQQNPDIYDLQKLHRQVIEVLGIANAEEIIPTEDELPPQDPITENASILNMGRVQAHEYQDQDAHIRVHMILMQDPDIAEMIQNSPMGQAIGASIDAHVREHLALKYRREVEKELGTPLPPIGQPLPEDVEKRISTLAADAAEQLLGKKQAAAQAEKDAALQEDPLMKLKEREVGVREQEVERKKMEDMSEQQLAEREMEVNRELAMLKMAQQERIADADREQRREKEQLEADSSLQAQEASAMIKGVEIGVKAAGDSEKASIERERLKRDRSDS